MDHARSCTWFKVAAGLTVTYATYKVYKSCSEASRKAKLRQLWDSRGKDVVTLHMFPRATTGPSPSPFPVKLELYLKIMDIKYVD